MKLRLVFTVLVTMLSFNVHATEGNYKYCSIAGFNLGINNEFMGDLAVFVLKDKKLLGTPICAAAWKSAFKAGKHFLENGKYESENDKLVAMQAGDFSTRVYESITKNMEF